MRVSVGRSTSYKNVSTRLEITQGENIVRKTRFDSVTCISLHGLMFFRDIYILYYERQLAQLAERQMLNL